MHCMQSGSLDKAQKFTEKAFFNINKIKRKCLVFNNNC